MCGSCGGQGVVGPMVQAAPTTGWVDGYKLRTPDGRLTEETFTSLGDAQGALAAANEGRTEWAGAQIFQAGRVRV